MADIVTGGLPNVGASIVRIGKDGWGGTRSDAKTVTPISVGDWMARFDAAKAALANG